MKNIVFLSNHGIMPQKNGNLLFMANYFNQFVSWFIPEELALHDETKRKAGLTITACILLQPFFIITVIKWLKEHKLFLTGNIALSMILLVLCMFMLKFSKSLKMTVMAVITTLYIYMTVYNIFTGGINSSSIYWMISIPLMSVLLDGHKSALAWAFLVIVQVICLKAMEMKGMDFDILHYESVQLISFRTENFIKQILAVSLILYMVEKDRIRARDQQNEALDIQQKTTNEQKKSQAELEKTTIQLKTTFEQISKQALQLNSESNRLSENSTNISVNFTEASGQSRIVSGNISEINTNLQDVSMSIEQAAASLQSVLEKVNDASKVAGNAVSETREAALLIAELSQSSREIGNVTEMIREISEQTNLLALNATIEAARAGEAGRGFAVVADEIKSLSIKTREATGEIHGRIKVNDDTVNKVVNKNTEIEKIIDEISGLQTFIHESLTAQSDTIRNIAEITSDSARKSIHIASGAGVLADSVSNVQTRLQDIISLSGILAGIAAVLQKMTKET